MAGRPNTQSPWKKRILIPFWIVRLVFMFVIIGLYAWALHYATNTTNPPTIAVIVVFMLLLVICILLDVLAILAFARDALKPTTFLIFNVIQTGIWFIVILLDVVAIVRGARWSGLIGSIIVFLSFLGLLIYAAIGYRREKANARRGQYAPAANPANPQAQPQQYGYTGAPATTAYHPQTSGYTQPQPHYPPQVGAASDYYSSAPGQPQTHQPGYAHQPQAPTNPFLDPVPAGHPQTHHGGYA